MTDHTSRLHRIMLILESLPEHRLIWVEKVTDILNCPHNFALHDENIMNEDWFLTFGDTLMIHHAFSNEPFTKDKFEHALLNTAILSGMKATLAPRGHRGHDLLINDVKFSLKTQADQSIHSDYIWISKYMELGKGEWTDEPFQLEGLVRAFLNHLSESDRILILRCLKKAPIWKYELIEIPKQVLERAQNGRLQMMVGSSQMPKPGYCFIESFSGVRDFQLYFDGGSERKLQVKALRKSLCILVGEWTFEPTPLINN